jgi:predicted nuclease of restriction endonuclease-like (RecB) superfamily/predicted GNAT family N-acyltransferase
MVAMMDEKRLIISQNGDDLDFYQQVADLLTAARKYAKKQLDNTIIATHFEIGRMIVEREQRGEKRAKYGAKLIKGLSEYLTEKCGRGFSVSNLRNFRQFYQVYSPSIHQSVIGESEKQHSQVNALEKHQSVISVLELGAQKSQSLISQFKLPWTHYQVLMRVENEDARRFYEIEAVNMQWDSRQLQRQVASSLYERIALSRDKDKVKALANEGQAVENPKDIFKAPYVFEFTGLEERAAYSETTLETALIDNLQKFLLEMGKGFLFEARQKRFTIDGQSFYVDLVLYNRLLQCYVIIDLKVDDMKHQDLGQLQMYVNYFDRYVKQDFEKPTIGMLLCGKKYDNIVELTLPLDSNIYASEYSLYLPDKTVLQSKLTEWIDEFEAGNELDLCRIPR